ncbi:MAG: tetratricopeptide repeat protein, partial [Candidatus Hermodarchaeota archaeon]
DTGARLNNLASLLGDMGRYEEAEPLHRRALAITEQALGKDHPDTGARLNNLAHLLGSMGRYEEAEPLHRRALAIAEQALGKDHSTTRTWLNNLVHLLGSMGRYEEAESYAQRALAITEQTLGKDHPDTGASLNNLAFLLGHMRHYEEAEPLYRRALAITEQALGKDHPDTGARLNNLASLLGDMGRYEEAEPLYRRALAIVQKTLGLDHPKTKALEQNIYNMKWNLGHHEEVIKELIDALRLEPEDKTISNRLLNLAMDLYKKLDKSGTALQVYKKMREIIGEDYEGPYQNRVGNVKYWNGEYKEAVQAYRKATDVCPNEAAYHSNLAGALEKLEVPNEKLRIENLDEAISALRRAYDLSDDESSKNAYAEDLKKLEKDRNLITHFGQISLVNMLPVIIPIAIEVAGDLIPLVKGKENNTQNPEVAKSISDMRNKIFEEIGIKIPGIRIRGNENDLTNGTYVIMLNEIPIVSGNISPEKRLFPGSFFSLRELIQLERDPEEAVNPQTGDEAWWIWKEDWEKVLSAKLELWDVTEYLVRHLEAVIRNNLSQFLGHQEVMNLLEENTSDVCNEIKSSEIHFTTLVQVLNALVYEQVPITALEKICEKFLSLFDEEIELTIIAEKLRSIPEIRKKLPGNNNKFVIYKLDQEFEDKIYKSIQREDHQSILAMNAEDCQEILTAVRDRVGNIQRNVTLLVQNAELRPFIHKLIELEFPHISVLSEHELLQDLEEGVLDL